ncbi:MAG TPA: hypothetical protein VG276_11580 [Actinomycetes bacterium]|nr:hypothetical protein [Actinomycetes bacterium]
MSMQSWREPPDQWEPQGWEPQTREPQTREPQEPSWEADPWEADRYGEPGADGVEEAAYLDDGEAPAEPNGGVVAAIVAAGLACAIFGSLVVATAASPAIAKLMTFYWPAGPLTGKSTVTIVAYLVIWPNLHYRLRDRHLDLYKAFLFTLFLVGLGLVGTFPPFYQMFQPR